MSTALGPRASARRSAIELLSGWSPPDAQQEALRAHYVEHLSTHSDGLLRGCLPDHLTASTAVLDPHGTRILLTLHGKADAWFQVGGHLEPGDDSLVSAATREACEESGLRRLRVDPVPVHLDIHRVPFCAPVTTSEARGVTRHLDVRFLAVAEPSQRVVASAESREVRWWPVDDLPSTEASLLRLVQLSRARLRG